VITSPALAAIKPMSHHLADLLEVFLGQGHGGVSMGRLAVRDHKV
jgi:hypothetical protein